MHTSMYNHTHLFSQFPWLKLQMIKRLEVYVYMQEVRDGEDPLPMPFNETEY